MKAVEQGSEVFLEPGESLEIFIIILFAIDPSVNASPKTRRKINHPKITPSDQFVEQGVGFGKKIVQFDFGLLRADPRQSITHSAGSAIVTLSKTGGEDQDSLFHNSLGDAGETDVNTADGSLMDIYIGQSKLWAR